MRPIVWIASVMVAVGIAHPRVSHGGSHGGGGHGGSRGSCGHPGGHGSRLPGCTEVSSVVGYRQCSGFGTWSVRPPALSFDFGVVGHRFVGERVATGTGGAEARLASQPGDLIANAVAPQLRTALQLGRPVYLANELEFGRVVSPGTVSATYAAVRGVAGLSVQLEPAVLSAELAGGARFLSYRMTSDASSVRQTRGELQARARLDIWLTPRMTVGAMVGESLVDRGDTIVAVSIGGHLRAFGGAR
jgi:hypothetical protein